MHFSTLVSLFAIASSSVLCHDPPQYKSRDFSTSVMTDELPFSFTYLFTAHLAIGAASKPIPVPGGVLIVEHILNGTVTGPAINATIEPSLATPSIINNGSTQVPIINVVGTTDDGFPFYISEAGIGSPSAQVSRIVSVIHLRHFRSCV